MTAPMARLAEDQPVLVADIPVSGRSRPLPLPLPEGFAHDLRFHGGYDDTLVAYCLPCGWAVNLEAGHRIADLIRLAAMHAGVQDQVTVLTEALLRLCGHHVDHPMTWPHEDGA